jgi:hypothetical protein
MSWSLIDFIVILYGFCFFVCCPSHQLKSSLSLGLRMDCRYRGLGWVGYQTWLLDIFFMIYLPSFQGVTVFYVVDEWIPGYPVGSG